MPKPDSQVRRPRAEPAEPPPGDGLGGMLAAAAFFALSALALAAMVIAMPPQWR